MRRRCNCRAARERQPPRAWVDREHERAVNGTNVQRNESRTRTESSDVSGRKPKIVVIDDSEIVLEVTRGALEGAGFDVVTHDRPAGCVALILHEKPELVLMDVNMPGLGGDTIVSVLGKAAPTSDTVVLLHSSLSAEVLRAKATTAGAHGFIQKSGDLFGLVREVNRWLKRTNSG